MGTIHRTHSECVWPFMLTDVEFERRKPVWSALSELWLDIEITSEDVRRIACVAAASGYDIQELNDIYLYEVAPVVSGNLLIPAGAWAGFHNDWLHTEARKRAESRNLTLRLWVWSGVGRKIMTYAVESHWREILHFVETTRLQ